MFLFFIFKFYSLFGRIFLAIFYLLDPNPGCFPKCRSGCTTSLLHATYTLTQYLIIIALSYKVLNECFYCHPPQSSSTLSWFLIKTWFQFPTVGSNSYIWFVQIPLTIVAGSIVIRINLPEPDSAFTFFTKLS